MSTLVWTNTLDHYSTGPLTMYTGNSLPPPQSFTFVFVPGVSFPLKTKKTLDFLDYTDFLSTTPLTF